MLRFFELSAIISKFAFCATVIINLIFINLTISYTTVITGTYRKMLVIFAASYIIVSCVEVIAEPCIHNFNGGVAYFSLAESSRFLSVDITRVILLIYAACYVAQLSFIAIQFLFRYFTLIQHPFRKSFQSKNQIIWVMYYFGVSIAYGFLTTYLLPLDNYSDSYFEEELIRVYQRNIKDTPRVLAVAYENGKVRWSTGTFLCVGFVIISLQYTIIIFCTIKMQSAMQTELRTLSTRNKKLEMQFFKALTVQIILPTFLITVPIGFVLITPLLDITISCQSGLIYALYSIYPPLDSIATLLIINEYKYSLAVISYHSFPMLHFYELSAIIIKIGFFATFITNAVFITLTIFYTKRITGTYRKMLVTFATLCVIFSAIEVIVEPCIHNFNGGAIYFSLNSNNPELISYQTIGLVFYASCYVTQFTFIALQFLFRYVTLIQHPLQKTFQGRLQVIWILYILLIGTVYGLIVYHFLKADNFSDLYFQEEMQKVYSRDIRSLPRVMEIPYENGKIRWKIIAYFCSELVVMESQYLIIIICAIKMHKAMKTKLSSLSTRNRKLERQFFKALSVQIFLPTFLITLPIGSVLILPLFDIKISCQTGIIFALYSLYPPLDSVATMLIVTEYKYSFRALLKDIGYQNTKDQVSRSGNNTLSLVELS